MRLLGIDFETTGLDPAVDTITEVGAVLWDTELSAPILVQSFYLDFGIETLSEEITQLTGITLPQLKEFGLEPEMGLNIVHSMLQNVTAFVAHNGTAFDSKFYKSWCARVNIEPASHHWIDTQNDLPYPDNIKTRKLTHLAAEHKFLNPFDHRAVFDVLTMLKVMDCYDPNDVLKLSCEPTVCLQASVTYPDRKQASDRGYRWNGDRKIWWRTFKESQVAAERSDAPFATKIINAPE